MNLKAVILIAYFSQNSSIGPMRTHLALMHTRITPVWSLLYISSAPGPKASVNILTWASCTAERNDDVNCSMIVSICVGVSLLYHLFIAPEVHILLGTHHIKREREPNRFKLLGWLFIYLV